MSIHRLFLFSCLCCLVLFHSFQLVGQDQLSQGEYEFILKVKQLEEFIHRFNHERMPDNKPVPSEFQTADYRKEYLATLFDSGMIDEGDSSGIAKMGAFIISTVEEGATMQKDTTGIIAEVPVTLDFAGVSHESKLFFEMEKSPEGYLKWVLVGVEWQFLEEEVKSDSSIFLPPNLHLNKFIGIPKWLNQKKNAVELYPKGFEASLKLAKFYTLINEGKLNVISIQALNIRYHVLQIKKWVFVLEYFNRDGENAGWLISSLQENNHLQGNYLNHLLSRF